MAITVNDLEFWEDEASKKIIAEHRNNNTLKGSIVFVHGICHGAWCWKEYVPFFSKAGYQCYAFSLRGHGKSKGFLTFNTLTDYVKDVKMVVQKCIDETGVKPFLLGHSMGGAVVQKYIGEYEDTVAGAILFAPATAPHMSRKKTLLSLRNKSMWDASLLAIFGRKKDLGKSAFFDSRIEDTSYYEEQLQRESIIITLISLYSKYTNNTHVNVPVCVLGSEADLYFPEESLLQTAKAYGLEKPIMFPAMCHDMMLDPMKDEAANAVLQFMESVNQN